MRSEKYDYILFFVLEGKTLIKGKNKKEKRKKKKEKEKQVLGLVALSMGGVVLDQKNMFITHTLACNCTQVKFVMKS